MKEVVNNLRTAGAHPLGSCCGHGKYHKTIIVKTTDHRNIDYYSGVEVPRKKRFYVRDCNGAFFIPEVEAKYSPVGVELVKVLNNINDLEIKDDNT
jgi:hypothetical protein